MPTLERVQQLVDNAQYDTYGARVQYDWSKGANHAFANLGMFVDEIGFSVTEANGMGIETVPGLIHDPYVGAEIRWNENLSRLKIVTGWRFVLDDKKRDIVRGNKHIEITGNFSLNPRWSIELHGMHQSMVKKVISIEVEGGEIDKKHMEGTWQLGIRRSPDLSLGAIYDYTTDDFQPKTHYVAMVGEYQPTSKMMFRFLVGASPFVQAVTFGSSRIKTFGTSAGGLKCVSGVCRDFPPFDGAKVDFTIRY